MMLRTKNRNTDSWFTVDGVRGLDYSGSSFEATRYAPEDPDVEFDIEADTVFPDADKVYLHIDEGQTAKARWLSWEDSEDRTYLLLATNDVFVMNADGNTIDRVKV